jgi:predicted nuclease of predicted toxin-antitoxin system
MRKLLANENFPYKSIYYLRSKGFDVLSIGMDNPSILDSEIMTIAINQQRTILTFDRDYGELIFRRGYKPEMGVIYLRLDEYEPDEPGIIVERVISNAELDLTNALTVVDNNGIRQRRY